MKSTNLVQLETPRITSGKAMLIAGLRSHFTSATWGAIPEQWERLTPYLGKIPGQLGRVTYGLCFRGPDGIDYLSGVEVSNVEGVPGEFRHASIPAQEYVVFSHRDHVSKLYQTLDAVSREWLPRSGYRAAQAEAGAPDFFERYGEGFNPQTGVGDIEVWIPIAAGEQGGESQERIAS
jgi:AraC family transcriptional regulator